MVVVLWSGIYIVGEVLKRRVTRYDLLIYSYSLSCAPLGTTMVLSTLSLYCRTQTISNNVRGARATTPFER